MKKLAVLFPGIGYNCDKPLLYYAGKLALQQGFDVKKVDYANFPKDSISTKEHMRVARVVALEQAKQQLQGIPFGEYDKIVFISKSIGTAVATCFEQINNVDAKNIFYTPLEITFDFPARNAIVFTGTKDPWVESDKLKELCVSNNLLMSIIENGNHSLETGNILDDVKNLQDVMTKTYDFINREDIA